MTSDTTVTSALLDLLRAATLTESHWALIGGQALVSYGVPRQTDDADALVEPDDLRDLAIMLVDTFGWSPMKHNAKTEDYDVVDEVFVHVMDDDVLVDIGALREMIPLRTQLGLRVDLLSAQHPIEGEMIELAVPRTFHGVKIPVAPLGGILLVKTKADRTKDVAAIEQTAEHLPSEDLKLAIKWAKKRDASTTEDLQQVLAAAKGRLAPKSTHTYKNLKPRTPRKS